MERGHGCLYLTITSPLCSAILGESCHQAGVAALAAEVCKLCSIGPKFQELGWSCIPVETYGKWGKEANDTFSMLASHLAIHLPNQRCGRDLWPVEYGPASFQHQNQPGQRAPALITAALVCFLVCKVFSCHI